jgi:phosphatidylglycerol---prolipoprotein diacylglyceryl transferase
MHPILIELGPITIHTYGFLLAIGVLCGIGLSLKLAKKQNLDPKVLVDFIFYAILVGLVGAKVWYFVTIMGDKNETIDLKAIITAAGTFHGGIIFGLLFVVWYLRKHNLSFKKIADTLAPGVALAHFFGRMGCFAAGCCWGREASGCSIAVEFTNPETTTGVPMYTPLYPVQVMEAILNLINFIILFFVFQKKKFDGQLVVLYMFNYSIIRFFVEFFRGDDDRGYIIGSLEHPFTSISVPQLVSIVGAVTAIVLYTRYRKNTEETTDAVSQSQKKRKKSKKK